MHLAFPELCLGCRDQESRRDDFLCIQCIYELPYTHDFSQKDNSFERHFLGRVALFKGAALLIYTKIIENLIHQFKYEGMIKIGRRFGNEMGERIKSSGAYGSLDLIIPIPLHSAKLKKRGFNQSQILASEVGRVLDLPVYDRILKRSRRTQTQTRKSRESRIENLKLAFIVTSPQHIRGKHILLIDDVLTTGATLESAALSLLESGAKEISMLTLAMGQS